MTESSSRGELCSRGYVKHSRLAKQTKPFSRCGVKIQGLHFYCLLMPSKSLFLLFMKERHTPPPFIKIMNSTLYDAQNKYHN